MPNTTKLTLAMVLAGLLFFTALIFIGVNEKVTFREESSEPQFRYRDLVMITKGFYRGYEAAVIGQSTCVVRFSENETGNAPCYRLVLLTLDNTTLRPMEIDQVTEDQMARIDQE